MNKETVGVVLLETKNIPKIGEYSISIVNEEYPKKIRCGVKLCEPVNCTHTNFHFYFLSDKEFNVGDWVIDTDTNDMFQVDSMTPSGLCRSEKATYITDSCKKIIATTDNLAISGNGLIIPKPKNEFVETLINDFQASINHVNIEVQKTEDGYLPVVNQDGTVNCTLIKESWNREEVGDLIYSAMKYKGYTSISEWKEWVSNNL